MTNNALLKILAGPQTGAELTLAPREYVLGSGDDVDLVLTDAAVRPRHAMLGADESGWWTAPLDGAKVTVGGKPVDGKTALTPYAVIGLGGVYMALGPDGPWETLPEIPAPVAAAPAPVPAPPPPEAEPAPAAPEVVAARASAPDESRRPEPEWRHDDERRYPQGRGLGWLWWLLAIIVATAAGWFAWSEFFTRTPEEDAFDAAVQRLRGSGMLVASPAPRRPPPGTVGMTLGTDGKTIVTGLLATEADRRDALEALELPASVVVDRTTSVEGAAVRAAGELGDAYPGVRFIVDPGRYAIRLTGTVVGVTEGSAVFKRAREGLDRRIALRNGLLIWDEAQREAESAATRVGLKDAWFERHADGTFTFQTETWPTPKQKRDILDALRERFGEQGVAPFALALDTPPPEPEPPAPVQGAPSLPDLDPAKAAALEMLPKLAAPIALPKVEVEPRPQPVAPPKPEPEPEPAPAPAPAPEPPPPPPVKEWRVTQILDDGFVDQHGVRYRIGDSLSETLRIVRVWDGGVVLQRGTETVFASAGTNIVDEK